MSIGKQKTKEDGFVNVSTKVPPHVSEFLNIVAKSRGTDIYGLLQLFIQTLIRAAKCTTSITPEMKTIMHLIEMDADWNKAFNFASPSAMTDVAQVILVLQQYDGAGASRTPRKGFGLVMIDKPALPGETPTMNYCVDDILERVIEVSMRGLYRELRQIGVKHECESLRETLTLMCDAHLKQIIEEEDAAEMPQLGNFHDFGKIIEYGARTKQKKHRTPDSICMEQPILFEDFDRESGVGDSTGSDSHLPGYGRSQTSDASIENPLGDIKPFTEEP